MVKPNCLGNLLIVIESEPDSDALLLFLLLTSFSSLQLNRSLWEIVRWRNGRETRRWWRVRRQPRTRAGKQWPRRRWRWRAWVWNLCVCPSVCPSSPCPQPATQGLWTDSGWMDRWMHWFPLYSTGHRPAYFKIAIAMKIGRARELLTMHCLWVTELYPNVSVFASTSCSHMSPSRVCLLKLYKSYLLTTPRCVWKVFIVHAPLSGLEWIRTCQSNNQLTGKCSFWQCWNENESVN